MSATAVVPTTFMKLANFSQLTVHAQGEATRRMVDLSLVLDVSGSIGWRWPYVRDAARTFVDAFDQNSDRVSLVMFGNGARVVDAMPAGRGFDKARVMADIPNGLPGGSTAMVQGFYRGWDELRSVPNGQQSGLRIIVLFTDGCSNSVPGIYNPGSASVRGLRTYDFPDNGADPDSQTHARPTLEGLYPTDPHNGAASPGGAPNYSVQVNPDWRSAQVLPGVPWMPAGTQSSHAERRSSGIPTNFPLQVSTLTVNGVPQNAARGLRNFNAAQNKFPADVWNVNNSARNLMEIISNAARNDAGGDYPIRIYTIGMGELVRYNLGTRQEMSEEILKRIANDMTSPDRNPAQLEGKYYFAETQEHVSAAFQALQNQIIRLTK